MLSRTMGWKSVVVLTLACAPVASAEIENFDSDPGWTGVGNTTDGNTFTFSNTNLAGGTAGEAGGDFFSDSTGPNFGIDYYADTALGGTLSQQQALSASGRFTVVEPPDINDGQFEIGFFDTTPSSLFDNGPLEGIVMHIREPHVEGTYRVNVRVGHLRSSASDITLNVGTDYLFELGYDPNALGVGSGQATIEIFDTAGNSLFFNDTPAFASGGTPWEMNAFGILTGDGGVPSVSGEAYFDNLQYGVSNPLPPGWGLAGGGNWHIPDNWSGPMPNGVDDTATFGSAINAPSTVFSDIDVTAGTINFDNANGYVLAGAGSLTLEVSGGSAEINVAQGTHKINLPLIFASDTDITVTSGVLKISDPVTVNANVDVTETGTVIYESTVSTDTGASIEFGNSSHMAALTMASGSSAVMSSSSASALMVDSLSLASDAKIDLTTNDLIVNGGNYSTIEAKVIQGFNNGDWLGNGVTSSAAANDTAGISALGIIDNAEFGYTTFSGFNLTGDEILVKHTYYGDADVGGTVNNDDFVQFLAGYNEGAEAKWLNGDFDYNASVNLDDFALFLAGLQDQDDPRVSPELFANLAQFVAAEGIDVDLSTVPEPAGLGMLAVGAASLLRRRRR